METSNSFQKVIKNYLEERKKTDGNLAEAMLNEAKNISDCCKYIITKVKEKKVNAMTNEEVFAIAEEYYTTTKELKISSHKCKVVISDINYSEPAKKNIKPKVSTNKQMSIFDLLNP